MKIYTANPGSLTSSFGRFILTMAGVGLLASFAPPAASAGEADGSYQIKKLSASFVRDGDPITVPKQLLQNTLFKKDAIVITDNQIPVLRKNGWMFSIISIF